ASPPRAAGRSAPTPSSRRAPPRPAVPQPAAGVDDADSLPPEVEDVLFAEPAPPRSAPARQPVAIPFGQPTQSPARDTTGPARTANSRQARETMRPASGDERAAEIDGRTITQQILELLEQNGLAAVSQLRIEVHNRVVVVAGEVPSSYEKQ